MIDVGGPITVGKAIMVGGRLVCIRKVTEQAMVSVVV